MKLKYLLLKGTNMSKPLDPNPPRVYILPSIHIDPNLTLVGVLVTFKFQHSNISLYPLDIGCNPGSYPNLPIINVPLFILCIHPREVSIFQNKIPGHNCKQNFVGPLPIKSELGSYDHLDIAHIPNPCRNTSIIVSLSLHFQAPMSWAWYQMGTC